MGRNFLYLALSIGKAKTILSQRIITMDRVLRALIIEDSENDASLLLNELKQAGYTVAHKRIENKEQFLEALSTEVWDIIFSDFTLPQIDSTQALDLVREIDDDIPFIFVSDASEEERAANAIKMGANDYIIKENLKRLAPTVEREINEARIKKQHKAAKQALEENKERFHSAFEHSSIGMAIANFNGIFLEVNSCMCSIFGYDQKELINMSILGLIDDESLEKFEEAITPVEDESQPSSQIELRFKQKNGNNLWIMMNISLIKPANNKAPYYLVQFQDRTEQRLSEEQLIYLTKHDPLTGLINRSSLDSYVTELIKNNPSKDLAVVFIKLDRLNLVNNTYGPKAKDHLLKIVAERFKSLLSYNDALAYLGNNEFALALSTISSDKDQIIAYVEKLRTILLKPIIIFDDEFMLTASIGIGCYPEHGNSSLTLLKVADIAAHSIKKQGGDNYAFYNNQLSEAVNKVKIETKLRHAIESTQFLVHYQPLIDARSKSVSGIESLIRWQPDGQMIMPDVFIPIAEETGLIIPIGEFILNEACKALVSLQKNKLVSTKTRISVNLSPKQFRCEKLLNTIENAIKISGINPSCLELEITEGTLMHNMQKGAQLIKSIYDLGVEIAVDDFGVGYSSLNYLKNFKVHRLKIDKSFVQSTLAEQNSRSIIISIISLAHSMGLKVTAEGVETKDQVDFLAEHHCDEFQGYYFSHPLNQTDLENFLKR